jgi:lysophospholipase L1-like esterase
VRPARRRRRRAVLAALALPVALVVVLAVEVAVARRGPVLDGEPLRLDGPVGPLTGTALRVVWLGDSTAAGVGVDDPGDALPVVVARELGVAVDLTVLAVSGARVADVVDEQLPAVAALEPDVVLVSVGANDVTHLTSRDDLADRYRQLVGGLPDRAAVVLLGVPDMGSVPRLAQPLRAVAGFRGRQLDEVVREVARDVGATYVPIARATGPAFRREPDRMFAADEYHPSAAGYRLWADAVIAATPSLAGDTT